MNYKQEVEPPTPELPETGILSKSSFFREFLLTKRTHLACPLQLSFTLTRVRL